MQRALKKCQVSTTPLTFKTAPVRDINLRLAPYTSQRLLQTRLTHCNDLCLELVIEWGLI